MDCVEQLLNFVFGQADAQNVYIFAGIRADAFPPCDAPAQLIHDDPAQLPLSGPCENQRLHADILLVGLIHHHSGGEIVDHGINCRLRGKKDQAECVQKGIEGHGKASYSETAALFAQA